MTDDLTKWWQEVRVVNAPTDREAPMIMVGDRLADALRKRSTELEAAHEKWRKERSGIGFACHDTGLEQERAFAKADSDFAFTVSAILSWHEEETGGRACPPSPMAI